MVWECSNCADIGCCLNAPMMNSQNSSKRFGLKIFKTSYRRSIVGNLWSCLVHKHGVLMLSLRTWTMCAVLNGWKWTCSGVSAVFSFWPFIFPSSLSHSAVSQCVSAPGCGPQYELAIDEFCLAKFRLDMQELDQRRWCSWEDTVEWVARTHTHDLRDTSEALLQP